MNNWKSPGDSIAVMEQDHRPSCHCILRAGLTDRTEAPLILSLISYQSSNTIKPKQTVEWNICQPPKAESTQKHSLKTNLKTTIELKRSTIS